MTSQDLKDLLDYIQEHNSWEHMMDAMDADRSIYKYIDINICYDTRDTDNGKDPHLWWLKISLRDSGKYIEFRESDCTLENIIKFLNLPLKEARNLMIDNKR